MEILSWFLDRIDNRDRQFHLTLKFKQQHLPTVEKAKDYIFNNYYEDINLTDIACYCNISPFHFSRIFKTISNCTPYQFLLETRLTNAKQLIARNNDLPLKEVCYKSGFQSPEHFNAAFKKRFSYPPSYFKRCQKTQGF
jgi:AraC-like DNA-binding protein